VVFRGIHSITAGMGKNFVVLQWYWGHNAWISHGMGTRLAVLCG